MAVLQGPPRLSQLEAPRFAQSSQRKSTRKLAKRAAGVGCGPPPTKTAPSDAHSASLADGARVIVVGGGIGGLATAGRLARAGFDVTVLEKNAEVGGRAQSVTVAGARFDTGPSLLLFPDKYREAFEALGSRLEDHVQLQRVEPAAYRVFFEGGTTLDLLYDVPRMMAQLEGIEAGAGQQYLYFLADARAALDMGVANFIEQDFTGAQDLLRLPALLPLLLKVSPFDLLLQHDSRLAKRFSDWRIRALFSFQDLYVGLSPYTAPGVFSLLAATELTDGVWYPIGGFGKVRNGLCAAAESCGVVIRTGAEVRSINSVEGSITGVSLASGEELGADVVVANCDVPGAFQLLRSEYGREQHRRLSAMRFSAGVISYNWVVRDAGFPALLHHNVFISGQGEEAWQRAGNAAALLDSPNFYVHCPSRTDPTAAAPGHLSVMVLLPVANMQERGDDAGSYEELVGAGRRAILQSLQRGGVGDLGPHILHESVIDPPEWRARYGLEHGAAFGMDHGLDQLAVFRPAVKDARIRGLYFAGASTRPGNGVPLVLIGSRLTAERVIEDRRQQGAP